MLPAEIPFKFEMPIEVFLKAGDKGKERRIGGIISTETKDRHGEVVLQRGLDFSYFLSNGWFNDNHSKETTGVVGYPIKVEKTIHKGKQAHYVEGYLIPGYKPANDIWDLANALQKTGRRLGFSIEGGVRRRSGSNDTVVAEAGVRNVAITNCPVNTDTGMDVLAKSMQVIEAMPEEEWIRRALSAGNAITAPATPAPGDGFALRTESMEREPKRQPPKSRRLRKSEVIDFFFNRYVGMTDVKAERLWQFAKAAA